MAPLCNLGRKFEHKNGPHITEDLFLLVFLVLTYFSAKNQTKSESRPFCFWSSSNFGPKTRLNLSEELFFT